jgi:ubiquitin-protein ligase
MSGFISKDTVQRLLRDVKQIMKNPLTDNGIYYQHDEEDMLKGYALIVGPSETPYYGGFYFFQFTYPYDYPHSPPKVEFKTNGDNIRFNPNLYVNGKVCVSILNTWSGDQWTSCQTISTVLLTLCTLLCKNPLLNEPGVYGNHKDIIPYEEIITYKNIEIAILRFINKDSRTYSYSSQIFDRFYDVMKENFLKLSPSILEFLEKNLERKDEKWNTMYYDMKVTVNYNDLYNNYKQTYETLKNN